MLARAEKKKFRPGWVCVPKQEPENEKAIFLYRVELSTKRLHLLITYTPYILGQRPVSCGLIDDLSYLKKIRPSKQQMFEEIR